MHHVDNLVVMRLACRSTAHGKILAGKMHQAAVDVRAPGHHPIGGHLFSGHPKISGAMKGKQSDLLEAAGVHQPCHPLPRRQLAGRMLFLNALLATAEFELRAFRVQRGNLLGHCLLLTICLLRHPCSWIRRYEYVLFFWRHGNPMLSTVQRNHIVHRAAQRSSAFGR